MKIVLNRSYGGYMLSEEAARILGVEEYDDDTRYNPGLIALIEKKGSEFASGRGSRLKVYEIPDNATDYRIIEYDGVERILYVKDGTIYDLY